MKLILSVDAVRFPLTGIGRYVYELARGLQVSDYPDSLKFLAGARFLSGLPAPNDSSVRSDGFKRLLQQSRLAIEIYSRLAPTLRKFILKGHEDFIFHGPNFYLPPFDGPKIATFHDLSPFKWTECHDRTKVAYLQREFRKSLDSANGLITVSKFIRHELAEFAGLPLDKIFPVHLAAGGEFRPRGLCETRRLLEHYGLSHQGYSLFVGTIEPRKNILRLLDAYELLPKTTRQRYPLVLSGYRGWASDGIHDRLKDAERQGWAKYLGYLPADDLPLLYSGARLFAFPSLYEGFGLPVLEAMQSGVPVVCSDSASLPEVAGNAALQCSPEDVDGLSAHLYNLLINDEVREEKVSEGILRAEEFTWKACVENTLRAYKAIS